MDHTPAISNINANIKNPDSILALSFMVSTPMISHEWKDRLIYFAPLLRINNLLSKIRVTTLINKNTAHFAPPKFSSNISIILIPRRDNRKLRVFVQNIPDQEDPPHLPIGFAFPGDGEDLVAAQGVQHYRKDEKDDGSPNHFWISIY